MFSDRVSAEQHTCRQLARFARLAKAREELETCSLVFLIRDWWRIPWEKGWSTAALSSQRPVHNVPQILWGSWVGKSSLKWKVIFPVCDCGAVEVCAAPGAPHSPCLSASPLLHTKKVTALGNLSQARFPNTVCLPWPDTLISSYFSHALLNFVVKPGFLSQGSKPKSNIQFPGSLSKPQTSTIYRGEYLLWHIFSKGIFTGESITLTTSFLIFMFLNILLQVCLFRWISRACISQL